MRRIRSGRISAVESLRSQNSLRFRSFREPCYEFLGSFFFTGEPTHHPQESCPVKLRRTENLGWSVLGGLRIGSQEIRQENSADHRIKRLGLRQKQQPEHRLRKHDLAFPARAGT